MSKEGESAQANPRGGLSNGRLVAVALLLWLGGCDRTGVLIGGEQPDGPGAKVNEAGLALWSDLCASCHGDFLPGSTLSSGNQNGDFRLDVTAALERHGDDLERYIDSAMPQGRPGDCKGSCAEAMGAYLRFRKPSSEAVCDEAAGPAAGSRQVMLLTSREYQHALEDLLGVPTDFGARVANHDGRRGGFVDMTGRSVSSTLLDTYTRSAAAVADWALSNGRPFTCSDQATCADRFVDEFLFQAFRGPVSDEQKAAYRKLFTQYPEDGLSLALKAVLTSPLFLYRVEVGVTLEEAKAAKYYDPAAASTTPSSGFGQTTLGEATETKTAAQFQPGSNGALDGDAWALTENGRLGVPFSTPLTDPTTIEVRAHGSNYGELWPDLTLRVNGAVVDRVRVGQAQVQSYRFEISGVTGNANVEILLENDAGEPPYGPGQDVNLYVHEVRLITAQEVASPAPPPQPPPASTGSSLLNAAVSGAHVLDPYEFASTLAFRLTGAPPDRALLDAARNGWLSTREQVRAQVERLIDSERGRARLSEFVARWFRLDEIDQVSRPDQPELTDEVKAAMQKEVQTHFLHVFYDDSVPYSEFFGGDYTFLNASLAAFYGVPGQFDDSFRKAQVEGRGGPIASGAFMTVNAHAERTAPILRAVRTRQTALCHYVDPPNSPIAGDDIDEQRAAAQERVTAHEEEKGALSSRDFYFYYTDGIDACAGCHKQIINPMFGMEDFDNVGRLRPSAGAGSVIETIHGTDTVVSIEGTLYGVESTSDSATIDYAGAKDLSNQLADTQAIHSCLARKTFRFVTGQTYVDRDLDADHQETMTVAQRGSYGCVAKKMLASFESRRQSPRAMFIELATDSLLLFRR